MPKKKTSQSSDIKEILINATEVQLAGTKAGISFWRAWVDQASNFADVASNGLNTLVSNPNATDKVLLQITEASRKYAREMNDLPEIAAKRFIEALEEFRKAKKTSTKKSPSRGPKRSARVKG